MLLLREATYTDEAGRMFKVMLPQDAPAEHARLGVVIGPPPLDGLGLPFDAEVRLNLQLFSRGIFTARDAKRRPRDVHAAIMGALRADIQRVVAVYEAYEQGE